MSSCWQCHQPVSGTLFCHYCNSLQPPPTDYYKFFGLEPKLSIDPAILQKRFYALSFQIHPDRYSRKSAVEQNYSLEATSILNDGYRTLKDPVRRAEYLLKRNGFDIGEQRSNNVPPELLEEVFELNMTLEELRQGDESVRPQLGHELDKFVQMRGEADHELNRMFAEHDSGGGRETMSRIRAALNRRRYITNLIREVEHELGKENGHFSD